MDEKKKVLVVEDDRISAMVTARMLEKHGHQVVVSTSGENGLEYCERNKVDLIILDIVLPGMSGIDFLKSIRKKYTALELPIIVVTAKDTDDDVVLALSEGASDYLLKPIHISVALARVETQLKLASYYRDSLKKTELEALASLIVTYNHKINNPLTVALGNLKSDVSQMDNSRLEAIRESIERISVIVKQIEKAVAENDIEYGSYGGTCRMVKIGKKTDKD